MLKMIKSQIFTKNELLVIDKKLNNKKLNQIDSNYLYKFIKPKLVEISALDAESLLNKMKYNQKIKSIENNIVNIIKGNLTGINSIIIYGSAIQTNYSEYNDIDIMIITNKKIFNSEMQKYKKINEIKNIFKTKSINLDIEIITKEDLINGYKNSPSLIYQLKDSKVIYGNIKIPEKIELYNIDLLMKLDWSDIHIKNPSGKEIYNALRNTLLVRLLLNKIIDNNKLRQSLNEELGKNLINNLKNNTESKIQKMLALDYLKNLINKTREEIKGGLWEKIEL